MVYAAIGGMQLKRWTGYFKIILPTLRVLKAAKRHEHCLHADTFKDGAVFFAVSVWDTEEAMKAFAKSGLHGQLSGMAIDQMAMFFNHSAAFDATPSRAESVAAWTSAIAARQGKGTVGHFTG